MNQSPYLSPAEVMQRFGISLMTLWRWENDRALGFPKAMLIRRRKFFLVSEIEKWERQQQAARA